MNHMNWSIFNGSGYKFEGTQTLDLSKSSKFQQLLHSQYFGVGGKNLLYLLKKRYGKTG